MRLVLVAVALLASCVQPMTQPEPQQLESAFTPVEVIRRVASALVVRGFVVVVSDADAGVLTMVRSRPPKGNADLITCNWMAGSSAEVNGASTLTISLSARARGDSASAVVVSTRTLVSFPGLSGGALAMADSEDSCTSNGTAESAIVTAITK